MYVCGVYVVCVCVGGAVCCVRCCVCVCGLLLEGCLICVVPRCTRSGAGVSVYVTDLVTPGRLGKMRLRERVTAGGEADELRSIEDGLLLWGFDDKLLSKLPSFCAVYFWLLLHFNYIVCKARGRWLSLSRCMRW